VIAAAAISVMLGSPAYVERASMSSPMKPNETAALKAAGTFDVKLTPQDDKTGEALLGRMTIDKQFRGDLEGTSQGQMLTAMTATKGSAGYVAIEKVSGTLQGTTGTFVLQHSGTMARGAQSLTVSVVPDSGTGQLTGLSGTMRIIIADGKHSYEFDYTIEDRR
jgi:Protein of unknown function (DUF3224)